MYCPECGLEYREGVTACIDCDVALTIDPPPEPPPAAEWRDLETVLETDNPAVLVVGQSFLNAEGIPCYARGELLQKLLGIGPVQLEVPRDRSEEARALLRAASQPALESKPDEAPEDQSSSPAT